MSHPHYTNSSYETMSEMLWDVLTAHLGGHAGIKSFNRNAELWYLLLQDISHFTIILFRTFGECNEVKGILKQLQKKTPWICRLESLQPEEGDFISFVQRLFLIHPFSFAFAGGWSRSQRLATLWTGGQSVAGLTHTERQTAIRAHIHTATSVRGSQIAQKEPTQTGGEHELHTERPRAGFKPTTFLPWGDSANRHTAVWYKTWYKNKNTLVSAWGLDNLRLTWDKKRCLLLLQE